MTYDEDLANRVRELVLMEDGVTEWRMFDGLLDVELALDLLGGPIFYRLMITGGSIDERLAENVVELILRGFAPSPPRARKPSTRKGNRSK
jgi:hypothetical protein